MTYPEPFERLWDIWRGYQPNKADSKMRAFRTWEKTAKIRPSDELLEICVRLYFQTIEKDKKFKCHLATFLSPRDLRWEGFLEDAMASEKAQEARSEPRDSGDAWDHRFDALEAAVGHDAFCHWFLAVTISQCNGVTWVDCPNKFHKDYLENKFGTVIKNTFGDVKLTVSAKKKAT